MPSVQHVSPKKGDVLVLVGTMKGAFIFCSDAKRKRWKTSSSASRAKRRSGSGWSCRANFPFFSTYPRA